MRPIRTAGLLIFSGGLHALLLLICRNPGRPEVPPREAVTIKINQAFKPVTKNTPPAPTLALPKHSGTEQSPANRQRKLPQSADTGQNSSGDHHGPPSYRDLIRPDSPAAGGVLIPHNHGEDTGQNPLRTLGAEAAGKAWLAGEKLSGNIHIPYELQRVAKKGTARARIRLKSGSDLELESLTGSPVLRAVLFGLLNSEKNRQVLRQLMQTVRRTSYLIRLEFSQGVPLTGEENNFTQKTLTRPGSLTVRVRHNNVRRPRGILPDAIIKKENQWERIRVASLRTSPAFKRPLYNFKL